MTEAIVTYLNSVIDTVGRVDVRYCMAELRSDGTTTVPYSYVGTGNVQPINIDGGSLSYWRMPDSIAFAQIEAQYGKPRLSGTYPLRLVIIARRKDSTVDDGFMPTRLAEDIANALAGSHPDLKLLLKANTVSIAVTAINTNITSVWGDEFIGTGVSDPNYTRVIMALNVSVTVVGDRACWENECDYDPDILHLFDFCKPAVVARLTDEQVACLEEQLCVDPTLCELIAEATATQIVDCLSPEQETAVQALVCEVPPTLCEQLALVAPVDVVADVFDCLTEAAQTELLDSECVIPPCADATITQNGAIPLGTVASGGNFAMTTELDGVVTNGTYAGNTLSFTSNTGWIRDLNWIAIPTLTAADERFVGVLAIFENSYNQLAWQITGGGTINWGDGTTAAITGAVQTKVYDYATLAGTVNVYHDGRNYKQVLVDITRTGAAFTDFRIAAATVNVGSPCTFLDIAVSLPSCTILALGLNRPIAYAERVLVKSMAAAINTGTVTWVFAGATSMQVWEAPTNGINGLLQLSSATAPIDDIGDVTSSVTTAASRYAGAWIKAAGNQTFNTATSIQQLFDGCLFVQDIGNITATSATAGGVAFIRDCKTLHTIGTINCPLWTSLNLFASGCLLLGRAVFTNCALITVTTSAFQNCYSLYYLEMNGLTRGINLSSTCLGNVGMSAFANSLGTASGAQTITATGTPFSALITAGDATALAIRAVITGKGYTYVN